MEKLCFIPIFSKTEKTGTQGSSRTALFHKSVEFLQKISVLRSFIAVGDWVENTSQREHLQDFLLSKTYLRE